MTPRRLWSWLFGRTRREACIREELQFHLEEDAAERLAEGSSTERARRGARLDFGNVALTAEDTRAAWTWMTGERLWQDICYAVRRLAQAPVFSLVAILSLALGIGANAAVFSLFNEVLLRPLSVPDSTALINLSSPGQKSGNMSSNQSGRGDDIFSYAMFRDLERAQPALATVAGYRFFGANLAYGGETLTGQGALVSGSYFDVLRIAPALGRLIGPDDDKSPGDTPVVVLSYPYWADRFGMAGDVVGKTMIVNGESMTIVGVGADGFQGTTIGVHADVFVPITMRGQLEPPFSQFDDRRNYWVYLFGRLGSGVTIERARAGLNGSYQEILASVEAPLQKGLSSADAARFKARTLVVEPGSRGQSVLPSNLRAPLQMLFAVTAIVLIIACANVANLLLARSAARTAELAIRASIGAGRRRLVSQLLIEACVLSVVGGVAGLTLGQWTLLSTRDMLTPMGFPTLDVHLDGRVLAFSLALSLATGLLFGVFPALHSTRAGLASGLKHQAARSSGARSAARFRTTMILAQMALSTTLLVSAGLFIKSLVNVSRVDLGIQIDHLLTFTIWPKLNGYTPAAARDLFERTEAALAAAPGVTSASASTVPLVGDSQWGTSVMVEGFSRGKGVDDNSSYTKIGPGFFKTTGMTLLAGRDFTTSDTIDVPKVAIVNETFAKKFGLAHDAVGKRMGTGSHHADLDMEIVGLVRDAKYSDVKTKIPPVFYAPYRQDNSLGSATFYIRTPLATPVAIKMIRDVMTRLDPNLPVRDLRTMADQVRQNKLADRVVTTLASAFAMLATLLATVGLYGVLAYTVSQRTREFGLRMALGAAPARVRRLVLGNVGWMTLAGAAIGAGLALLAGHYLQSLLYQMTADDPIVFVSAIGALTLVALAAGFVPAWRASRIEPMQALRHE